MAGDQEGEFVITKYFAEMIGTRPGLAKLTLRETKALYIIVEREPMFGTTSVYVHHQIRKDGRGENGKLFDTMEQALNYLYHMTQEQLINARTQVAILEETVADLGKAWSAAREKGI